MGIKNNYKKKEQLSFIVIYIRPLDDTVWPSDQPLDDPVRPAPLWSFKEGFKKKNKKINQKIEKIIEPGLRKGF